MKFSLLIFDLDGTLADTQGDLTASVNHVLSLYGKPAVDIPTIRSYIGNGVVHLIERAIPDMKGNDLAEAVKKFRSYYGEHLLDNTGLFPGIKEVLNGTHGIKKAVLTNKLEIFSRKILSGLDIIGLFDVIWGGDTGPQSKPSPEPLLNIIGKLRAEPASTLMIGDSANDILSARAAGAKSCAAGWGYTDKLELLRLKPDFFAETPMGLKSHI